MATANLYWYRKNTYPSSLSVTNGITTCSGRQTAYVETPESPYTVGYITFAAEINDDCISSYNGTTIYCDANNSTSICGGAYGETGYVSDQGDERYFAFTFRIYGDDELLASGYDSLNQESYASVTLNYLGFTRVSNLRLEVTIPYMGCGFNLQGNRTSHYLVSRLPPTFEYDTYKSAPTIYNGYISATNSTSIDGVSYRYTTNGNISTSYDLSTGCPNYVTNNTSIYQNGALINSSNTTSSTFTLAKCPFGNPYTITCKATNSQGDSNLISWNVLVGGKPTISASESVVYLTPGGESRLYITGVAYGPDTIMGVGTSGDVAEATLIDYTLDTSTGQYTYEYSLTGIFNNTTGGYLNFEISDTMYGRGDTINVYIEMALTCTFTYSPVNPVIDSPVVFNNTSVIAPGITYTWTIDGESVPSSNEFWDATLSGNNMVVTFYTNAVYSVNLNASYEGLASRDYTLNIDVGKSVNVSEPRYRYKIGIFRPDTTEFMIIGRTKCVPANNSCIFYNLKFGYSESSPAPCTFKLIGANTITDVNTSALLREGSRVAIFDDYTVVWTGIITDISLNNTTSPYNNSHVVTNHLVTCMDASYELMLSQYEDSAMTITDTIQNLLEGGSYEGTDYDGILPDGSVGIIGYSSGQDILSQMISYTFSNIDRYSLLSQLIETTGWKFRSRPNIIEKKIPCDISGAYVTFTSTEDYHKGDIIYINLGYTNDGIYTPGIMITECEGDMVAGTHTIIINPMYIHNPDLLLEGYMTVLRQQSLYDIAQSFYQYSGVSPTSGLNTYPLSPDAVRTYVTDKDINDVNNSASVNDKYGVISVTSRSIQNTSITSTANGFMLINPDYTIPSAYVVVKSIDSYVISTNLITRPGSMAISTFDLKGWTTPTDINEYFSYGPCVLKPSGTGNPYAPFTLNASSIGSLSTITRILGNDNEKYTRIGFRDYIGDYEEDRTWAQIVRLTVGAFVLGNRYTLNTTEGLSIGDNILLGDEHQTIINIEGNDIIVDRSNAPINGHGHMVGTLVFKISSIYGYQNADIEEGSPIDKYGKTTYTTTGPNGQTQMELEIIAQNLLRFGSNYMDNGSAKIPLMYFGYSKEGTFNPLKVGDHISIRPSYYDANAETEFELQEYEVNADKYMVDVKYGMPSKSIVNAVGAISKNQIAVFSNPDYQ